MGKIRNRINPHLLTVRGCQPLVAGLQYIETGDPAALAQIQQSSPWEFWRVELRKALDLPSPCDAEDLRHSTCW